MQPFGHGLDGGGRVTPFQCAGILDVLLAIGAFRCEADVVILLDVDRNDERWDSTALYTAISRARHLLYIIWADN